MFSENLSLLLRRERSPSALMLQCCLSRNHSNDAETLLAGSKSALPSQERHLQCLWDMSLQRGSIQDDRSAGGIGFFPQKSGINFPWHPSPKHLKKSILESKHTSLWMVFPVSLLKWRACSSSVPHRAHCGPPPPHQGGTLAKGKGTCCKHDSQISPD